MYVRGMGRYRLGMGQGECPGGPGCNNPMLAAPLDPAQIAALSEANAAYFNQPTASGQPFTTWINQNAALVALAAGAVVLLMSVR